MSERRRHPSDGPGLSDQEYQDLARGDIIQHLGNGRAYVILDSVYPAGKKVLVAASTVTVDNPTEWRLFSKGVAVGPR